MSQSENSKATAADARSEQTRSFVRTVKGATRRKYPPEEKIRIVLEGFRREVTVNDPCRREGIKPHSYYSWTKEFMEAGKERLARNTIRDATRHEIEQLKRENAELKEIAAELLLETHRLKKRPSRRWTMAPQAARERRQEGGGAQEGPSILGAHAPGAEGVGRCEEYLLSLAYQDQVTCSSGSEGPMEPAHGW